MTLFDYLRMIRNRFALIISIIVVICVAAAILSSRLSHPIYQATSKIIVNKTNEVDGQQLIDQGNLAVNIMLINTYKELIKTPSILEEVTRLHPELDVTASELADKLKVTSAAGSQIMTLSVQDRSYVRASDMVNALTKVFKNEIPKIMHVENVTVLSESNPAKPTVPKETGLAYILLISFIVSAVLAILTAYVLEYFDRRLKRAEDVEMLLGIPVMASISRIKRSHLKKIKPIPSYKRAGEDNHVHGHS